MSDKDLEASFLEQSLRPERAVHTISQGRRPRRLKWLALLCLCMSPLLYFSFCEQDTRVFQSGQGGDPTSRFVHGKQCQKDYSCSVKAPYLSPKDMMEGWTDTSCKNSSIPRILHQSWGHKPIPDRQMQWSDQCRTLHPGWHWVLWTDEDNRELVKQRYPWFLETFDALGDPIMKADAVRNLYMHAFGGLYLDFDVECIRATDELFTGLTYQTPPKEESSLTNTRTNPGNDNLQMHAYFGWMGRNHDHAHSIPNDWMASSQGHPFFLLPVISIYERKQRKNIRPELMTGPVALREQIHRYKAEFEEKQNNLDQLLETKSIGYVPTIPAKDRRAEIHILEEQLIHPFSWLLGSDHYLGKVCLAFESTFDPETCKQALRVESREIYTVAYWAHVWESPKV